MFSAVQRAGYLGASDMRYVMTDIAPADLLAWWETKVGLREQLPPNYAMRLGSFIGDFIVDEYETLSGHQVTRRQDVVPSPVNSRFRSTLDGFDAGRNAVIEAKFAGAFFDRDKIFATYYPQVAMQMHCTNADRGFLVVAQGTAEPYEIECIRSLAYEQELLFRCEAMLESMDTMTPPVVLPAPVPPEKWRTVDLMVEETNWGAQLQANLDEYESHREGAELHEAAGKDAKAVIPDDVGKVLCAAHIIARNKKGSLVITRRRS